MDQLKPVVLVSMNQDVSQCIKKDRFLELTLTEAVREPIAFESWIGVSSSSPTGGTATLSSSRLKKGLAMSDSAF